MEWIHYLVDTGWKVCYAALEMLQALVGAAALDLWQTRYVAYSAAPASPVVGLQAASLQTCHVVHL